MTDLRSLHDNHRAFWRKLARACGGSAEEVPGGLIVATGVCAAPFNQAHCDGEGNDAEVISRAAAYFGAHGLPWRIICEQASPAAEAFGRARGSVREPLYPILTRQIEPAQAPARSPALAPRGSALVASADSAVRAPADSAALAVAGSAALAAADSAALAVAASAALAVTAARDIRDLRAFTDCAAASYRHDQALIKALVSPRAIADADFRFYLGRADGKCVAISVGVRDRDTVGVYFVGVRRGFRRRGYGRALTERAIQDGAERGARTAVLQATSAGYRLYLGMGFRPVAEYYLWDIPAAAAGTARGGSNS